MGPANNSLSSGQQPQQVQSLVGGAASRPAIEGPIERLRSFSNELEIAGSEAYSILARISGGPPDPSLTSLNLSEREAKLISTGDKAPAPSGLIGVLEDELDRSFALLTKLRMCLSGIAGIV